jgi:hypothetical protein
VQQGSSAERRKELCPGQQGSIFAKSRNILTVVRQVYKDDLEINCFVLQLYRRPPLVRGHVDDETTAFLSMDPCARVLECYFLCKSQKGAAVQSRDTRRAVGGIYKKVIFHLCESASEHSSPAPLPSGAAGRWHVCSTALLFRR